VRLTRSTRSLALAAVLLASSAAAQTRPTKPARRAPTGEATQADIARLQQQIDDQRAMMLRILQHEREHLDLLMKMLGGNVPASAAALPAVPEPRQQQQATAAVEPEPDDTEPTPTTRRTARKGAASTAGSVAGKVSVQGGSLENAVVYVDTIKDRLARGRKHEIKQSSKQFSPRFSVVPRGTTVTFPNYDSIFHNVFSLSPGNTFDLGTYRSGDKPGEVALNAPGVVQVFCNLHSQMSASVLVTPSRYFAIVKKDGSFEINDLPAGKHRLVAWMPNAEPVTREVEVLADGQAELSFSLAPKASAAHTNKFGQPYGSYQE
jgi:plastocyanin